MSDKKQVKIAVLKYTVASGKALPNGKIATVSAADAKYLCAIGHACDPDDAPKGWDKPGTKSKRKPNRRPKSSAAEESGDTSDDGEGTEET